MINSHSLMVKITFAILNAMQDIKMLSLTNSSEEWD